MKKAVSVLLRQGSKILGVSRRNEPTNMNLPGGKVDPGETPEEACVREVREETGLKISNLRLVFRAPCEGDKGDDTYDVFCYEADYSGRPKALEEGFTVDWISWDQLLDDSNSFADYNQRLFLAVEVGIDDEGILESDAH